MTSKIDRPDRDAYFMGIALAVRARANCLGNRVGAVLVQGDRVIATGYNGTPPGLPNCDEGGCDRCKNREKYRSGEGYDVCICVHAEQNALLASARFGIAVEGAKMYSTMMPCFGCAKEMLAARVSAIYYLHAWKHPDPAKANMHEKLLSYFDEVRQVEIADEQADWAVTNRRGKD